MNESIRLVFADKIAKWGLILSGVIFLFELAYIGILFFSLPPLLPIFNQLPWGDERLGTKNEILYPLGTALFFLVINFILISKLHGKIQLLSRIISITTFLIAILSLIFIFRTLQLII